MLSHDRMDLVLTLDVGRGSWRTVDGRTEIPR